MKLHELLADLSNDGLTDAKAIEIATDLIKMNMLKERLGDKLGVAELDMIIDASNDNSTQEIALTTALANFSPREKQCYLMREVGLLTYNEIGLEFGINEDTARTYVNRAKVKMSKNLNEVEV